MPILGKTACAWASVAGVSVWPSSGPSVRYCSGIWLVIGPGISRARKEVSGAAAIGHAQHQTRSERVLNVEVPVLVIGGFAADVRIAERDGLRCTRARDRSARRGRDEADSVTRIEERRRLVGRITGGPIESRLARRDAAESRTGVESKLAQPLPPVGPAADPARVCVNQRVTARGSRSSHRDGKQAPGAVPGITK